MTSPVLIVDDDYALRQLLSIGLKAHGYATLEAGDGATALQLAQTARPGLILLDLGLPDLDGSEVLRRLRTWSWTPVLILSVRDDDQGVVQALDLGADDYLTKPFPLAVLLARMRVALRRRDPHREQGLLRCGGVTMDPERRLVTIDGHRVSLTPNEYGILEQLMLVPERVLTHGQLLRAVWGQEFEQETQLLRVHISNLRRKLESLGGVPATIENLPGVGYRLTPPPGVPL